MNVGTIMSGSSDNKLKAMEKAMDDGDLDGFGGGGFGGGFGEGLISAGQTPVAVLRAFEADRDQRRQAERCRR
jgi:hypothetical protein